MAVKAARCSPPELAKQYFLANRKIFAQQAISQK